MTRFRGDLPSRTFEFACRIVNSSRGFPNDPRGWVLAKQTIRAGASIGANIREADNAFSNKDFAHKCSIARKEAAETQYWLQLAMATDLLPQDATAALSAEAEELTKILSTIVHKSQESRVG